MSKNNQKPIPVPLLLIAWFFKAFQFLGLQEVKFSTRTRVIIIVFTVAAAIGYLPFYLFELEKQYRCFTSITQKTFIFALLSPIFYFFGFTILSIYIIRKYKSSSVKERLYRGIMAAELFIKDYASGKAEKKIPRIVAIRPNFALVHSESLTYSDFNDKAERISGAAGIHIWHIKRHIVKNESQAGFVEIHFTLRDLPGKILFKDMPAPARNCLIWGWGVTGWKQIHLKKSIHVAIIGKNGQGKTIQLNMIIAQIYKHYPQSPIFLFDFKNGESYWHLRKVPNIIVITSHKDAIKLCKIIKSIHLKRSSIIKNHQKDNALDIGMSPIFMIIDELSFALEGYNSQDEKYFVWQPPGTNKRIKLPSYKYQLAKWISENIKQFRSAGMYFIIAGQDLKADKIPTSAKNNFGLKIAYQVASQEASKSLTNFEHAFKLPNIKGRFLMIADEIGFEEKLQCPLLEKDDLKRILLRTNNKPTQIYEYVQDKMKQESEKYRTKPLGAAILSSPLNNG